MVRQRVRIRFRKEEDLRLIGHRDLVRTWQRVLRRADVRLRMSEGFRPRPRMSLPSPLAVGICGLDEVLEVELVEPVEPQSLASRLAAHAPPGLRVVAVEPLPPAARTTRVRAMTFEIPLPSQRREGTVRRIADWLAATSYVVTRDEGRKAIDLRPLVEDLHLDGDRLVMRLAPGSEGSARPREVLAALGLDDLESQGFVLARSRLELEP